MSKSNDGIYTNRKSREIARDLTDMIQTQILSDVRKVYNPQWSRRGMWNQSYIEARIPDVPTMLLELLSHQNFADMRYGLDPRFRFLICRAIYKGMLRYICFQNKQEPIVQPLPPDRLYTELVETNKVRIGWKAVQDTLEESASPTAYILYSRKDSGGFDNGTLVKGEEIILPIETGIIHSYKVAAVNKGGISFPSEIVSVYRSPKGEKDKTVLIVNGFDRISGPASFESTADSLAGFLYAVDRGVPYLNDIAFIGDQFEFRRSATWNSNDNNGHGDSYNNYAGQVIAGNTFDYPFIHGQAMAGTGYSFVSCSHKSLAEGVVKPDTYPIIDLILGKQRQPVITPVLQDTLRSYLAQGGNLLVSGTNLFSDSWGNAQDRTFVEEVLKGKLASRNASKEGIVNSCASPYGYINGRYTFRTRPNPICYSIESVDGVLPADKLAHTILRYPENNIGAGIVYEGKYRTCLLGFPFEALQTPSERNRLMESILRFSPFNNKIKYSIYNETNQLLYPLWKIEATRQTVAQLAESSLVSQIYLITDDPHAKAIYPCNLIRTENIWSTKTLREIAGYASAHYTLIYTKTEELQLGMYALERFVAIADDTRSGMVYSDYYEKKEGKLNPHPVIDYQKGSLRDDFNFGSLLLYRSSTLQNAIASMDTEYTFAGLYDLRLKVSQNAPLTHINEYLYTEVENDLRKSGEDVRLCRSQEPLRTDRDGSRLYRSFKDDRRLLAPHFKPVRFDEQTFQTEASVIIPVRNRVRTIEDAIRSVLRQEASFPFNLIIIDNHSTDGTSERIQAIAATDLRIIHIQPERDDLGIGGAGI